MIIGGAVLIGLTLIAGVAIAIIYEAPSCGDGKLNQDETGVDCGGSCAYLCRADVSLPNVSNPPAFARAVSVGSRTDVIAYIENRNQNAEANDARYKVDVYDDAGTLLGTRSGIIDLPARSLVPVFIPGIVSGVAAAPRAFVTFDEDTRWRTSRGEDALLAIENVQMQTAEAAYNRTLVATVFDSAGIAIAASQTVVREVGPFGSASAVFTWFEPFPGEAARVDVRSVPQLP
jgi:hypothetical protein